VTKDSSLELSRRHLLQGAVAAGVTAALTGGVELTSAQPSKSGQIGQLGPEFTNLHNDLMDLAKRWTRQKKLARDDRFVYTVDLAQLMICFAQAGERESYEILRERLIATVVRNDPHEPYTQGMVAWRYIEGQPLDASGTTEALRLARALWLGSQTFNRPKDADVAAMILAGYARHEITDQGVWIIRNYFGFVTHSFASNSFLVDYDPDFIAAIAEARADAQLAKLARLSYGAIKMAVAPSGLLYDLLQPELKTLYPELDVVAMSPNDIVQFSNCTTVATTIARGLPDAARRILVFALDRLEDLRIFYYGKTGEPVNGRSAGLFELSALVRLATLLGSSDSALTVAHQAMGKWKFFAGRADTTQSYLVGEILMAIHALQGAR